MFSRIVLALPFSLSFSLSAFAADGAIEPSEAGPDFAVQGEYAGAGCGAQVIALGQGKFHIVGWDKGLPGTTPDAERTAEVDAVREGEKVVFAGAEWKGDISGDTLTGTGKDGGVFHLKKIMRESPTAGAKPPAGAIVLFDGTNADAWQGAKVDARGFLQNGTKSKQAFQDFTMHIEFRTPFMPEARGQGRGNSGVYLQDRYEVQVLDSFGLKGENNECGGIYTLHRPRVNMCFPPLSWQTYDIDYEAARFDAEGKKTKDATLTVKHNGVLIHDHAPASHATTSAGLKEGPEPGPIQLQNHGTPVFYRNIWVVEKK